MTQTAFGMHAGRIRCLHGSIGRWVGLVLFVHLVLLVLY